MRIGIKFSRVGRTRFVSHLDMQRLFSRALRRTGLKVKFSQGFNPHIVTSFASALSVGMETHGDYMEFYTTQDVDTNEVKDKLNAALPDGIRVLKAGEIDEKAPKLMAACEAAQIEIICETGSDALAFGIGQILDCESYICKKKSKGKIREFDIRPLIYDFAYNGENIMLKLAHSGKGSLSPTILIEEAQKRAGLDVYARAVRNDLLIKKQDELVSMSEMFKYAKKD